MARALQLHLLDLVHPHFLAPLETQQGQVIRNQEHPALPARQLHQLPPELPEFLELPVHLEHQHHQKRPELPVYLESQSLLVAPEILAVLAHPGLHLRQSRQPLLALELLLVLVPLVVLVHLHLLRPELRRNQEHQ